MTLYVIISFIIVVCAASIITVLKIVVEWLSGLIERFRERRTAQKREFTPK